MKYGKWAFFFVLFAVWALPVHAEAVLQIKGESRTPNGGTVTMAWRVQEANSRFRFYIEDRVKAEMVLENGKVVKIRRRVRFAGKDKWITLTDPLQIRLELKSGFYPFSAVLNYQKGKVRETVMSTGRFTVEESAVK